MPSPIPKKDSGIQQAQFDFPNIIKEILNYKKVARLEWNNKDYGFLVNGTLSIYRDGEVYTWQVTDGDMLGTDWVVIE